MVAPVLIPIFGALGLIRYPTKPVSLVRARSRKAAVLPREYGPINWNNAPVDLYGQPFRFPWSSYFIKKLINPCLQLSLHARSNYKFKFIQVPNRYWKEPVGYPRARPIGRGKELLDHQLWHLDVTNVPKWIHVAELVRDRNLSRRMAPCSTSLHGAHKDA